eukprot:CAMPEP_0202971944 /NCGR_PEP_ID=MMETSP1396-20130829/32074_1 /ASSEMBLY_ACC=CAM_ASM_000872 /TAXON_ID= /ORGANISM="Pseudokeronopsis sp., Strain Brazil" /LENGTH=340 /DNA_ID=CAMNT_0049701853 /DNA_START=48 /DNA_END=1070 /DNA_ORIENTATION=+
MSHFNESEGGDRKRARIERSALDQLKDYTVIVADTGDISAIKQFSPQDATTNPSLILKAAMIPEYASLVDEAAAFAKEMLREGKISREEVLALALDNVEVNIGVEIAKIVPGYVSIEVDARLSFDTAATVERAKRIISLANDMGVDKSKILIKVAATYEGIRAGEILEKEGIHCNLTLVFSLIQAAACAEGGITLISPFVGRIMDWYKAKTGTAYTAETDPGVLSVRKIYQYFKKFGYSTIVMGASFRNIGEIMALSGCDRLTIAPALLEELQNNMDHLPRHLDPYSAGALYDGDRVPIDEASFRYQLNEDPMATEKLAEGIRSFAADIVKLEKILESKF